jgi:hypothetical protein
VAIHAGLRRGHAGRRGGLDRLVAITAVYAIVADVMLVAELDRLHPFDISSGEVRRACDLRVRQKCTYGQDTSHDHTDPGDVVRALMKKLCHPSRFVPNDPLANLESYRPQIPVT